MSISPVEILNYMIIGKYTIFVNIHKDIKLKLKDLGFATNVKFLNMDAL